MSLNARVVETALVSRKPSPVVVLATDKKKKKKDKKKKKKPKSVHSSFGAESMNLVRAYADTLRDPFSNAPVKLGFGCLTPSELYTAYGRAFINAGSDGTFSCYLQPHLGKLGGGGALTWTNSWAQPFNSSGASGDVAFSNRAALAAVISECEARVVSGGIKAIPMIPGTAAPGTILAGDLPTASLNIMASQSASMLSQSPIFKLGLGAGGASATIRPIDPESFTFLQQTVNGYQPDTLFKTSSPVLMFQNLPPSCTVFVEFVLHFEIIRGVLTGQQASQSGTSNTSNESKLSNVFASIESMWSTVQRLVPSAATVNMGATAISTIGSAYHRIQKARGYFDTPDMIPSTFGGKPFRIV
jgi:hypothetical protein